MRLYHVACRSTEPDVNIRLGLDTQSWARFNESGDMSLSPRLRLAQNNTEDLSQLWHMENWEETVDGVTYDWFEIFNYAMGRDWRLTVDVDDAQPYLQSSGASINTRFRANGTGELSNPWFGY